MKIPRHRSPYMLLLLSCCFFIAAAGGLIMLGFYNSLHTANSHSSVPYPVQPIAQNSTPTAQPDTPKPPQPPAPPPSSPAKTTPDYFIPPVSDGIASVLTTIPTKQPVVFLGIDDGAYKDPSVLQMMKDNHIHASLFLAKSFIGNNPDFFKDFIPEGSLIEDHTLSHDTRMIEHMTYDEMKTEICGMADYELAHYGRRPILFRPPGGSYNMTMRQAAAACGMRAVVNWIAKANGGSMQYQRGNKLRPGDIVLLHFRPIFKQDMQAFINAMNQSGLHTELLEDWLAPTATVE